MDPLIPAPAARILDFIASKEAPQGYGTIYGNNQHRLLRPITSMRLAEVIATQPDWTKRFGSSACGRYQFMRATLQGLMAELKLSGTERFDAGLQDRLGYHLLKRRGYKAFITGSLDVPGFALALAKEWASFPVLADGQGRHRAVARGQSYYAGDGLNKALVSADDVESMLESIRAADVAPAAHAPAPQLAINPTAAAIDAIAPAPVRPAASPPKPSRWAWLARLLGHT